MRPDMAKVVTERPRRPSYHGPKSLKTHAKIHPDKFDADDHGSNYAPVSRRRAYGYAHKQFSDLIGPLRKYLRKQVGRRWNDVYSELCKTLDRRSMAGLHIWQHVDQEVSRTVKWLNGELVDLRYSSYRYRPQAPEGLYVHPDTGILCWADRRKYPKYVDPETLTKRKLNDSDSLEKIDGIWYWVHTEKVPDSERLLDYENGGFKIRRFFRTEKTKKQLNTKELEKAGLKNG